MSIEPVNTSVVAPLPWHEPARAQLERALRSGRMPHALLLHGVEGLGKLAFAEWVARAMFCEQRGEALVACGHCRGCALFDAGSHPDFTRVTLEDDKQQISVDQVRAATERLTMTGSRNTWRVAIVHPAQQMTVAAANSLLKTLEEPGTNSLLILVTAQRFALLPTIRSRCQQLGIARPMPEVADQWLRQQAGKPVSPELLRFASGAPLRALDYLKDDFEAFHRAMQNDLRDLVQGSADVTQLAQGWGNASLPERLHWLDHWLGQRIDQEICGTADPVTRTSGAVPLQSGAQVLNISLLFQCLDRIRELKATLRRTALQRELAVETLLLGLQRALGSRA